MNLLKKLGRAFVYPHPTVMVLLVPLAAVLLFNAFLRGNATALTYISYVVSAYTLAVWCVRIPEIISLVKKVKNENKYVVMYTSDVHLRVKTSLYSSLLMNIGYAIFQLALGLYHASVWFYAYAIYYLLLAIMRFFILRDVRVTTAGEDMISEYKRYRFSGILLLLMNVFLAFIVFYIAWQGRDFSHHMITTIAMAAFTFSAFTIAIINVVKYRKYNSPLFSASKVISLSSALVSMLMLESSMLSTFGTESEAQFSHILTAATGTAVCLLILLMAIYMIIHSTEQIKELTDKSNG